MGQNNKGNKKSLRFKIGKQQKKINEVKSWFLEKINKIDKSIAILKK